MEEKPLTESINKQYSKYGSLRIKEKESKIELCNAEDPMKFLTRIDSSIKDMKAKVKKSIDNSQINEDYESSYDHQVKDNSLGLIPMVKLERTSKIGRRLEGEEGEEANSNSIYTSQHSSSTSSRLPTIAATTSKETTTAAITEQ